MKTALVTTTINVPTVLELYRKLDSSVRFFIVGDLKTPEREMMDFVECMDNVTYFPPDHQKHWKCSEAIGWNCVQRRSIGFLEALKWGADAIVTIDDDNIPMNNQYFFEFQRFLWYPESIEYSGLQVSSPTRWYQPYLGFNHRGFPIAARSATVVTHITDANVGVAAGICLGDPDIDATTRIAGAKKYGSHVGELTRNGYVVAHNTHTVFNSQNTAFLRQFAPAMFMLPGVGRYDDIIASLLTQRVMRDRGYHVHFGPPFVWQQRNEHTLLDDLKAEMWGMEHVLEISNHIDRMPAMEGVALKYDSTRHHPVPVVDFVRAFYEGCMLLPEQTRTAGLLYCDDIETVLK